MVNCLYFRFFIEAKINERSVITHKLKKIFINLTLHGISEVSVYVNNTDNIVNNYIMANNFIVYGREPQVQNLTYLLHGAESFLRS